MKDRAKYVIYEYTAIEGQWCWVCSYATLMEARIALPAWAEAAKQMGCYTEQAIVRMSKKLVAPAMLCSDTVSKHRVESFMTTQSVPLLKKLPVPVPRV